MRKKYDTVFKLLRLADKNASANEAMVALRLAEKLIRQLDVAVSKREARWRRPARALLGTLENQP